ncbi:DNA fragmentation factor subunit beta [Triplophysa rosa]|uniref:DNA fragmentation factor subunit beta n=1 Tax=Triplophysa rosa TaxID=992332 RepID=A0A9W7WFV5_TRIRA|nr:DNA fragmentation factor subunit beta [Triplophysa rosa]KAI7798196.1 Dffb protein [Triplophysa rosa]
MHKTKPKMFKIRSAHNAKKYGVAAVSLKELIKKGCHFLKVSSIGVHICLYEDGTVVTEDYFQNLPENTELVLLSEGESWNYGFVYEINQVLGLDGHTEQLIDAARTLLSDEHSPKRRKIFGDILRNLKDNSQVESREDKEWFEGIHVRFKTKSAYMKYNCESRIRGYLKEVDGQTKVISNAKTKNEYKKVAEMLAEKLKAVRYNGAYFDRSEKDVHRLCTEEGWFSCEGAFDVNECTFFHSINPYGNRESRIIFSTWNLDHIIEKKRTVIPTLVEALKKKKSSEINLDYFYKLLFTRENLKLVHIVCHKKGAHELHCDLRKIYKWVKK